MKTIFISFATFFLLLVTAFNSYSQGSKKDEKLRLEIMDKTITHPTNELIFSRKIRKYYEDEQIGKRFFIKNKRIVSRPYRPYLEYRTKPISLSAKEATIFKFGGDKIENVIGIDLYFFTDSNFESAIVSISKDGEHWHEIDHISDHKKFANLSGNAAYKEKFKFVKVEHTSSDTTKIVINQVAAFKKNTIVGKLERINNNFIYSNSQQVELLIRDYRRFDGDVITVRVNGKLVQHKKLLTNRNKRNRLPLKIGVNLIEIKAENEGFISPNTMDLKLIDGAIINIGTYRVKRKKKKKIVVVREI